MMINSAGMWRKFVNSAKSAITDSGIGLAMGDSYHSEPASSSYYYHSQPRMDESGYTSALMTRSAYGTCWMMQQTENHSNGSSTDNDWDGFLMIGDERVKITDLCDLLSTRFVFLSGAKSPEGHTIVTFPDVRAAVTFGEYTKLITYLTEVPPLEDTHNGYVVVIDRRLDRWPSLKQLLWNITQFFPGQLHAIYILKPEGALQRALEFGFRTTVESSPHKIVVCQNVHELHVHLPGRYLTLDLAGHVQYNHLEWVQHRMEVERIKSSTQQLSSTLNEFDQCLRETELPNDADTTQRLIDTHKMEREAIKEDFRIALRKGLSLLQNIRQAESKPTADMLSPTRLHNVTTVERLLVQLEETERKFDVFWVSHETKLQQCLKLRRFENDFRQVQTSFARHMLYLEENRDFGDSAERAQQLLVMHQAYGERAQDDIKEAERLKSTGEDLIACGHYATDASLLPKCDELGRLAEALRSALTRRLDVLRLSKLLHEQISAANHWCRQGVDILSNLPIEPLSRDEALKQLRALLLFIKSADQLRFDSLEQASAPELRSLILMATTDTSTLLHQVVARVDDVRVMCERRIDQLQRISDRETRPKPVQAVSPERKFSLRMDRKPNNNKATKLVRAATATSTPKKKLKKSPANATTIEVMHDFAANQRKFSLPVTYSSPGLLVAGQQDSPTTSRRSDYVINELIQSELSYVQELEEILEHYVENLNNPDMQHMIPGDLFGNESVLFGNVDDIHQFHKETFLPELNRAISAGSAEPIKAVAKCFTSRTRDFTYLYTIFCQSKWHSDLLRQEIGGDSCEYFQECQRLAGHSLPLSSYLLKPVQRITKYQLLLKELLKSTAVPFQVFPELQQAIDAMMNLLHQLNAAMYQSQICGYPGHLADLGQLQLEAKFSIYSLKKTDTTLKLRRTTKAQQRQVFLYSKALVLCKNRQAAAQTPSLHEYFEFKTELPLTSFGLNEQVKNSPLKFELWTENRQEVYTLQAGDAETKLTWCMKLRQLLHNFQPGVQERPASWCSATSGETSSRSSRELSTTPEYGEHDSNNNPSPRSIPETEVLEISDAENNTIVAENPVQDELTVNAGDLVELLVPSDNDWSYVRKSGGTPGDKGWVPTSYLKVA